MNLHFTIEIIIYYSISLLQLAQQLQHLLSLYLLHIPIFLNCNIVKVMILNLLTLHHLYKNLLGILKYYALQ